MVGLQIVAIRNSLEDARDSLVKAGVLVHPSSAFSLFDNELENVSKQLASPLPRTGAEKTQIFGPTVVSPVTGKPEARKDIPDPRFGRDPGPQAGYRASEKLGMTPSSSEGPKPWESFAEQMKQQGISPTAPTAGTAEEFEARKEAGKPQMLTPGASLVDDPGFSEELRLQQEIRQREPTSQVQAGGDKITTPAAFEETGFAGVPPMAPRVSGEGAGPITLPPAASGEAGMAPPPPPQMSGQMMAPGGGYVIGGELPYQHPTQGLEKIPEESKQVLQAGASGKYPAAMAQRLQNIKQERAEAPTAYDETGILGEEDVPLGPQDPTKSAYGATQPDVSTPLTSADEATGMTTLTPGAVSATSRETTPGMLATPAATTPAASPPAATPALTGMTGRTGGSDYTNPSIMGGGATSGQGAASTSYGSFGSTGFGQTGGSSQPTGTSGGSSEATNPQMPAMGASSMGSSSSKEGASASAAKGLKNMSKDKIEKAMVSPGADSMGQVQQMPAVGTPGFEAQAKEPVKTFPVSGAEENKPAPAASPDPMGQVQKLPAVGTPEFEAQVGKGLLIGPAMGFGGVQMEDDVNSYMGSPYEAKAMDLCAKQCRIKADLNEIPCVWDFDKKDPNEKKRKALNEKMRKIRSEWMRLHADLMEWSAKTLREDDKTQKSMNKAWLGENLQDRLNIFYDTSYQAQALECLSREQELEAKMNDLAPVEFEGGIVIDPDKKKRENLRNKIRECRTDFMRLQAKVLKEQSKAHRKHNGTTQKSLPEPPHKPQPVGVKREVTPMKPFQVCREKSGDRRFAGDMGTEFDMNFFHKAQKFEELIQKMFS